MQFNKAASITQVAVTLLIGTLGCQSSNNGAAAPSTDPVASTTTIAQTTSSSTHVTSTTSMMSEPAMSSTNSTITATTPGTLPTNLEVPTGMTVTSGPTIVNGRTTATLSCSGRASTTLTDLTAMLNQGGYHTKWVLGGGESTKSTAILEGSAKDLKVRAIIDDDTAGKCRQVRMEFFRP